MVHESTHDLLLLHEKQDLSSVNPLCLLNLLLYLKLLACWIVHIQSFFFLRDFFSSLSNKFSGVLVASSFFDFFELLPFNLCTNLFISFQFLTTRRVYQRHHHHQLPHSLFSACCQVVESCFLHSCTGN